MLRQVLDRGYRGIAEETLIAGSVEEVAEGFGLSKSSACTEMLVRHLTYGQPKI